MTVSIKTTVDRSNPSNDVFTVKITVIDVVGIEFDVFVFDTEAGTFSRVASVYDMEAYPVSQAKAVLLNSPYYRIRVAEKSFDTIDAALDFETVTKNRLNILAEVWDAAVNDFTTDTSTIFTASSD